MQIRSTHKALLFFLVLFIASAHAAVVSRVVTFSDGSVLYASDLNTEFNNLVNNINALDNDNLSPTANISPAKVGAGIDGSGITRDGGTGALSVNPDGVTVELSSDQVRLKDNGVSDAKLRQSAGLSVLGNSTNSTANVADITASSDNTVLKRSGTSLSFGTIGAAYLETDSVTTAKIQNSSVTPEKMAALNIQTSGSSGAYSMSTYTTWTDIPNLSATIITTGRPVMVVLQGDQSGSSTALDNTGGNFRSDIRCLRNGSTNQIWTLQPAFETITNFMFIDYPSAGTYTYKFQQYLYGGTFVMNYWKVRVYEL
jgi:hypothetical protein